MQQEEEIKQKIEEVEKRLQRIFNAIEKEKSLPFFQRRFNICRFLDIEKRIYSAVLKELKWVINE
jgi:5-bromo-4-chloroindolyl phosphate hydrolysis protein